MKIVLIVLAVVVLVALIFAVIVAMQSPDFRIARSTTVNAPPQAVFAQVNDFHKWEGWSPWAKLDPSMKVTYGGPPSGVGSTYAWTGNKEVGEGRMEIVESKEPDLVRIRLEFEKPFKATNMAEFTFKPDGDKTNVTWAMTGTKNFMFKAVHLIMNMDKMLGTTFDQGLAQMKSAAEAAK